MRADLSSRERADLSVKGKGRLVNMRVREQNCQQKGRADMSARERANLFLSGGEACLSARARVDLSVRWDGRLFSKMRGQASQQEREQTCQ